MSDKPSKSFGEWVRDNPELIERIETYLAQHKQNLAATADALEDWHNVRRKKAPTEAERKADLANLAARETPLPHAGGSPVLPEVLRLLWDKPAFINDDAAYLDTFLTARIAFGAAKYGMPLSSDNGRNYRQDAEEECADAALYAQALRMRGDKKGLQALKLWIRLLYMLVNEPLE